MLRGVRDILIDHQRHGLGPPIIVGLAQGSNKPRVIGNDIGDLFSYFRAEVIKGPDAFVETARGFEEFQRAMERKLLKELQSLAVSTLPAEHQ